MDFAIAFLMVVSGVPEIFAKVRDVCRKMDVSRFFAEFLRTFLRSLPAFAAGRLLGTRTDCVRDVDRRRTRTCNFELLALFLALLLGLLMLVRAPWSTCSTAPPHRPLPLGLAVRVGACSTNSSALSPLYPSLTLPPATFRGACAAASLEYCLCETKDVSAAACDAASSDETTRRASLSVASGASGSWTFVTAPCAVGATSSGGPVVGGWFRSAAEMCIFFFIVGATTHGFCVSPSALVSVTVSKASCAVALRLGLLRLSRSLAWDAFVSV